LTNYAYPSSPVFSSFFFHCSAAHRDLHSFPTRRSSDLFDARIAHPDGELRVAYENDRLTIDTPVPAELVWKGKTKKIKPGKHEIDRKSTRLNSSHLVISYAVFCLKKKKKKTKQENVRHN